MSELFAIEKTYSPRSLWMKKHNIHTHYCKDLDGSECFPWTAYIGTMEDIANECNLMEYDGRMEYGATEDDALLNLIAKGRVRHWNHPAKELKEEQG